MSQHLENNTAYAFKHNQLVHISNVTRGLRCGCYCVSCGLPLVAKKGQINAHHFAHIASSNCQSAAETTLHLLSKEIFKELNNIVLPQYYLRKKKVIKTGLIEHEELVVKGGDVSITNVFIEKPQNGFTPDITLICNSKILFVEIAVTHTVDKKKMRCIRKADIPLIEIRLEMADALLSKDELTNKLRSDISSKHWLFHPKQRNVERRFYEKVRSAMRWARKPAIQKKPENPIFSPYTTTSSYPSLAASNLEMDRLQYAFFLKYNRQPTSVELDNFRYNFYKANYNEPSYAAIKGKKNF